MGHAVFLGMTIHPLEGTKKQAKWDPFCRLYSSCFQTYASRPGPNVRPSAAWRRWVDPSEVWRQVRGAKRLPEDLLPFARKPPEAWDTRTDRLPDRRGRLRDRVHGHGTAATTVTGDGLSK